ncbi:phosphate ABC transporter substrate-binding protein [Sphingomonas changnyeongensis]|uniref:Phosphate ABC transporter substrate-binding protein n=1 Tax=Sphingomonas changnyeongensis TaxID=2698679 RepID=A0A7Z2S916_9SPHN|nr:substrate-binding domain-containing protein [Sphingomonas changnyeongensis]QHL90299.1 phosphate ABC transporter substrate-binding protein [Sphingomonas changnyeongensis]
MKVTRAFLAAGLGVAAAALSACQDAADDGGTGARAQIRVVGSSTVYPFTTAVAEQFVRKFTQFQAPIVESTGTGAGMKLFCAGVGAAYPDIENASRRIKASEHADCVRNGVTEVIELQIGVDGLAFAQAKNGPRLALSEADVYRAIAAAPFGRPNTARTWRDINPALPAVPIKVYGPSSTSGTRDSLVELVLKPGCETDPATRALKSSDPKKFENICAKLRDDGAYVDSGENDNLIVQKLNVNPTAIGAFGYSFLEENLDTLRGVAIQGVMPSVATIQDGSYPGARPLFIYVKKAHLAAVPGLREFIGEYAIGWRPGSYLSRRDLIPAPPAVMAANARVATELTPLDPAELK